MMLLLCYKALWSLTCGGHITSSEVERLVPGSHAAADEENNSRINV